VLNRLTEFEASMKWAQGLDQTAPRLEFLSNGGTALVADELAVGLPNGHKIVRLSTSHWRNAPRDLQVTPLL
jgi:putative ATP-binding cassette transporter